MKKLEAKKIQKVATVKGGAFDGKIKNIRIRERSNNSSGYKR